MKKKFNSSWLVGLLIATMAGIAGAPPVAAAECPNAESDPYPFGECGDDDERRVWCFVKHGRTRLSGTDYEATPLPDASTPMFYWRSAPMDGFVANPYTAPLPSKQVYEESNDLPGLQPEAVTCQNYVWWDRCNFWMELGSPWTVAADDLVA